MRIHQKYMEYDIDKEKDDYVISNINIIDKKAPYIHVFKNIAENARSVKKIIHICECVEQMSYLIPALRYGVMEMKDPSNGIERQEEL